MATSRLHAPRFGVNHQSTDAALNANETIESQLTQVNAPTLLYDQYVIFQLSNQPIRQEVYPMLPAFQCIERFVVHCDEKMFCL
jgi:hypothetical protein